MIATKPTLTRLDFASHPSLRLDDHASSSVLEEKNSMKHIPSKDLIDQSTYTRDPE